MTEPIRPLGQWEADLEAESRKPGPTMTITKAQYGALLDARAARLTPAMPENEALRAAVPSSWLIERGQSEKQVPTVWYMGGRDQIGPEYGWTTDANKAQRYFSRDAAETAIEARSPLPSHRDRFGRATEHVFLLARLTPAMPENEGLDVEWLAEAIATAADKSWPVRQLVAGSQTPFAKVVAHEYAAIRATAEQPDAARQRGYLEGLDAPENVRARAEVERHDPSNARG